MANEFKVKKGLIVDGTGTVLDVQGTQGQLFSVTDSLTGDLFSVSDVSGIPILSVNADGTATVDGEVYATRFHGNFTGNLTGNAGSVSSIGNLTGHITSANRVTSLGSFTTAELNAAISDGSINSQADTLDTVCDRGASTNQTLTSTSTLGLAVVSSADARIEIQGAGSNWSYVRLKDSISTAWDIASHNGGQLEWRPAGGSTNRMTYTSGGILTTGDAFTSTKGNTAYGWGDHSTEGYLTSSSTQSKYVRSDADDNVTGHTEWQDNYSVRFGDSADFRIFHDSTNNFIRNYKASANSSLQSANSSGTNQTCVGWGGANGYANLHYAGSQKLITVSGGVSVTGTVVASSNIGNLNTSSDIGQQLEYGDANVATLRCDANRWRVYMGGSGNSQETLTVTEEGRVGVKDSSPDYPLDVNGSVSSISIYASHDIAAYSDARVKGDIKTIPNALEKVNNLRGVTFVRTDEGSSDKRMMGVIAQEVKDIVPEVVTKKESDGHYAVSYGNMVGLLIESIKELTAEVESLKKQIDGCTK
jgi:cytoskeletal protein CcmA (bactofilin family)